MMPFPNPWHYCASRESPRLYLRTCLSCVLNMLATRASLQPCLSDVQNNPGTVYQTGLEWLSDEKADKSLNEYSVHLRPSCAALLERNFQLRWPRCAHDPAL